ncbi:hypothetical protein OSB04_007259 [Centaurea solstitialis]|uniref:UDP-glucuronosyl/UDP-glucosyltransferase n=1 Tax=Centaurea solstitialis TaxID=347529 RepID=A0AA38WSH2_9ASTR|nr:hypothetical protein OSB04_007259 [Centaurea solstitialis]
MKNTHVMVIPYPAQGHVTPLMELARCLTSNSLKVTFVNSEFTHKKMMSASGSQSDLMQMVWIPDGMQPWEDRRDMGKLAESINQTMPTRLEELIEDINKTDSKITCIVADVSMGWAVRVAQKMGIRSACFNTSAAAILALIISTQKLLDDEVIDRNGVPLKDQMIQLSTTMPSMNPARFTWACIGDPATNKIILDILILGAKEAAQRADWIICNSTMQLETGAFTLFPKMLPIGPLLATNCFLKQEGHFWKEDSTCLTWLDQQPVCSVIYVAFGSYAIFDQAQFEELALGLELTDKPFLWAVRPGISGGTDSAIYPDGFVDRVGDRGKIVSWAPQQEALSHPSVACFMSHCGWNSTMEGVSNGVPFLCWPYFADQFLNTSYVCDIWKTGLGLEKDENSGVVTRGEIKSKVEQLLSNNMVKENALNLKDKVGADKSSNTNLSNFISWVKEENANANANDGMQPLEDRRDFGKLAESMNQTMPTKLEIDSINKTDNKITCIIADYSMGWAIRVARKMGIRSVTFCPSSAALLALIMSTQKLLEDEVIDRGHRSDIWCLVSLVVVGSSPVVDVGVDLRVGLVAQGHVIPLMEAARCLTSKGLKVTFVNTEITHKQVMSACSSQKDLMQMVWIPDGMQPWEDRRDFGKLSKSMNQTMPTKLEELIDTINKTDNKITCIIADYCMGWAIRVAQKKGIRSAVFCPSSAAILALIMSTQKLLEDEVIDRNGDLAMTKIIFDIMVFDAKEAAEKADWIICNSTMELETGTFTLFPKMLPIGPLLATNSLKQAGHFWKEDSTCLTWLDQQPVCSVIYVAFGSFTILDQIQFEELALGLELTNKPFLWAVRPGTSGGTDSAVYPDGFVDRVGNRGKMVSWTPQQEVLSHPSVACFMSHCGWNSTMEGVSNGVPFLCWPYFADQFLNMTYICEIWKTGLGLEKDETSGVVTRGEIKSKVEQLLSNNMVKENALNLKEKVRAEKTSNTNLSNFISWVKEGNANANANAPEKNTCK